MTTPSAHTRKFRLAGLMGVLVASGACFNSHVFDIIDPCEVEQVQVGQTIEPATAADILIVVDNSGSMCEEQQNLIDNFYNPNEAECPLADPAAFEREEFINPTNTVVENQLNQCGFIQILAAFDAEFRVGVITTDVGPCDNRFHFADDPLYENFPAANCALQTFPDWGRRPQRGCLQAPADWDQKFLDPDTPDIGAAFEQVLNGVRTYGSPFERGLDAAKMFLDPATERHESCATDLEDFIRPDASLLVVFLTDEDDCSHEPSEALSDETFGESCDNDMEDAFVLRTPSTAPVACYEQGDALTPVAQYTDYLKNYKQNGDVRIAVIGGATREASGLQPSGCRILDGVPNAVCTPSRGNSNDPGVCPATQDPPCCEADSGNRYFDLASGFGADKSFTDSICFESFRQTMIALAKFAAAVTSIVLPEEPPIPEAITVELLRAGTTEPEQLERIPDNITNIPEDQSGWQLSQDGDGTGAWRVSFYGDAVPQPGDDIAVYVLAAGDTGAPEAERCIGFSSANNNDADAGG